MRNKIVKEKNDIFIEKKFKICSKKNKKFKKKINLRPKPPQNI